MLLKEAARQRHQGKRNGNPEVSQFTLLNSWELGKKIMAEWWGAFMRKKLHSKSRFIEKTAFSPIMKLRITWWNKKDKYLYNIFEKLHVNGKVIFNRSRILMYWDITGGVSHINTCLGWLNVQELLLSHCTRGMC